MRWKRGEGRTSSVNKGTLLPAKDVTPAWERGAIVSHDGWRWEGEGRLVPRSLGRGTRSSVLHPLNTFLSHFSRSCEFELAGEPDERARVSTKKGTSGSHLILFFGQKTVWSTKEGTTGSHRTKPSPRGKLVVGQHMGEDGPGPPSSATTSSGSFPRGFV